MVPFDDVFPCLVRPGDLILREVKYYRRGVFSSEWVPMVVLAVLQHMHLANLLHDKYVRLTLLNTITGRVREVFFSLNELVHVLVSAHMCDCLSFPRRQRLTSSEPEATSTQA